VQRQKLETRSQRAPDFPVPQEHKAPTVDFALNPNGWVTWQGTEKCTVPVRWRTGLSGAPIASNHPNGYPSGWGREIPPNHHNFKHPRFLKITFNTRALAFTPRHNSKDQSLSMSQIYLKHLVTCEREILCSFELLLLGLPFFFFILTLKCFVSEARDIKCVVVLASLSDP
jgi:hypothetical protein